MDRLVAIAADSPVIRPAFDLNEAKLAAAEILAPTGR
jgi:hypothetical protein